MNVWDTSNPNRPTALHDGSSTTTLDYPIDYSQWLSDIGDIYANHAIVNVSGGITNPTSSQANGIVTVWIAGGTIGALAQFTVRLTTTGGRTDDRTFYLKIIDR